MIKRYIGKFRLHAPCFITHYYVGGAEDDAHDWCIKCLRWKYPTGDIFEDNK